jgi:hypothetical protein
MTTFFIGETLTTKTRRREVGKTLRLCAFVVQKVLNHG